MQDSAAAQQQHQHHALVEEIKSQYEAIINESVQNLREVNAYFVQKSAKLQEKIEMRIQQIQSEMQTKLDNVTRNIDAKFAVDASTPSQALPTQANVLIIGPASSGKSSLV